MEIRFRDGLTLSSGLVESRQEDRNQLSRGYQSHIHSDEP
jgi:hypothetical protein